MNLTLLLVMSLVAYRLTRLVVHDSFPPIARSREWVVQRTQGRRTEWIGELISCHWCASVWIAGFLTLAVDLWYAVSAPLLAWGAVAAGSALISQVDMLLVNLTIRTEEDDV